MKHPWYTECENALEKNARLFGETRIKFEDKQPFFSQFMLRLGQST